MTMQAARYAIYFTPEPDTPLGRFGRQWLGRCALTGERLTQPVVPGLPRQAFDRLTAAPRRYGFHATLKPPFALAEGQSPAALARALEDLCADTAPFPLPALRAARLGDFLALVPQVHEPRLDALAAACVTRLDGFRAPPDVTELARRARGAHDDKAHDLLVRWGYPHVLERYRFHLSLTGPLENAEHHEASALQEAARRATRGFASGQTVSALSIFEEPPGGGELRLWHRAPLRGRGRLVYVVGPSGSGKDSVIAHARERLAGEDRIAFARRTITRPASAGDEGHIPVTEDAFEALHAAGAFAMAWRANGNAYGIGAEIRNWLARGMTVVVNGSRAHLPQALGAFSTVEVVHVTAPQDVLAMRLGRRAREDTAGIAARLGRPPLPPLPPGVALLSIRNAGPLERSGDRLVRWLRAGP